MGDVIITLRDIRRLVGTFHVLRTMLSMEVDWVDLLAYSALQVKAPATIAIMRRRPAAFAGNPMSASEIAQFLILEKKSSEERLDELVHPSEKNGGTKNLLGFLFPWLSEEVNRQREHADALSERRPFLTTLRMGLLAGEFSRDDIQRLVASSPEQIQKRLQQAYNGDTLDQLIDRLDDIYLELSAFDQLSFWRGVATFVKKPDCEWPTSHVMMFEAIRSFAQLLQHAVRKSSRQRSESEAIFWDLQSAGESELTAHWLRHHIFVHGLFGRENRGGEEQFLNAETTETLAHEMSNKWREEHLSGKLISCRWNLQSVYTMIDTETWDKTCQQQVDKSIADDRALDGFTLMLFGGHYSTEKATVAKICSYEKYIERVKQRLALASASELHETVRIALKKAAGGGW